MKALHITLTVLTIIFLVAGVPALIGGFNTMTKYNQTHLQIGVLIGNIAGYFFMPAVFWIARHFVGKKIAAEKNN